MRAEGLAGRAGRQLWRGKGAAGSLAREGGCSWKRPWIRGPNWILVPLLAARFPQDCDGAIPIATRGCLLRSGAWIPSGDRMWQFSSAEAPC